MTVRSLLVILAAISLCLQPVSADESHDRSANSFSRDRLIAWCIVPFDAAKRGPAERVAMLKRLGLSRVAYDWRAEHVPTFEEEILAYKSGGIEFFAFWSWHDDFAHLAHKHDIHPQFWLTNPSPDRERQSDRVAAAAERLLPTVRKAAGIGCKVGLYNHGGWGGRPENLVAVAEQLRDTHGMKNVGIVYNFHHGHDDIEDFADSFALMKPYLLCVNLNGMVDLDTIERKTDKILPIGSGVHEEEMIRVILESGYSGPIGILDHRNEMDAEESLRQNLDGLERLLNSDQ